MVIAKSFLFWQIFQLPNYTRKAQLTQRGTCNSSACLKVRYEQNLSSPIPATMFHLHSPEGTTGLAQLYWLKIANFPYPLLFSALVRGDPVRIYGKALQFLKLESSEQTTVKIW